MIKQWDRIVPNTNISRISFVYETWQPAYDEIIKSLPQHTIVERQLGLPLDNDSLATPDETEWSEYLGHRSRPMTRLGLDVVEDDSLQIVLVDDVLQLQKKNLFLTSLFSIFSHHYHLCVILITQQIFANSDLYRSLVRNTQYILVLKSSVATSTLRALQTQFFIGQPKYLQLAYQKILTKGESYLYIDLSARCDHRYRVKHGLLENEVRLDNN
jgi:hypothetical protein